MITSLRILTAGSVPVWNSPHTPVTGWRAWLLGVLGLLPIPLTFVVGLVIVGYAVVTGEDVTEDELKRYGTWIEGTITVTVAVVVIALDRVFARRARRL